MKPHHLRNSGIHMSVEDEEDFKITHFPNDTPSKVSGPQLGRFKLPVDRMLSSLPKSRTGSIRMQAGFAEDQAAKARWFAEREEASQAQYRMPPTDTWSHASAS